MKNTLKKLSLLLMVFTLVLVVSGCDKEDDSKTTSKSNSSTITVDDEDYDEEDMAMATEDVYGEDLENISRYPDSIRTYYAEDEYEIDLTYETTASESEVRSYYKDLAEKDGWVEVGKATDYIDFEKGDEDNPEMLTVYFTPYEDEGFLEYELVYSPPLTEEELAEMEAEDEEDMIELE